MNFKTMSYLAGQFFSIFVPQGLMEAALRFVAVPFGRAAGKFGPLRDNVRAALSARGENDEIMVNWIACENMKNFVSNLCDLAYTHRLTKAFIKGSVEVRGLGYLDGGLIARKGVIIACAHVGNWELAGMTLARLGYPITALALAHRQRLVNDAFQNKRQSNGVRVLFLGQESLKSCYRLLGENGILGMMGDLLFGTDGIPVNFLGKKVLYPKGIARFWAATGAAVVPVFCFRTSANPRRYLLDIHEPLQSSSEEELTQAFATLVENVVKQRPEQWFNFKRYWEPPSCQN